MHFCQHSKPVSYEDYVRLPDVDGIVTPSAMDAFTCGRPASCKFRGTWYCEEHMDAIERGEEILRRRAAR